MQGGLHLFGFLHRLAQPNGKLCVFKQAELDQELIHSRKNAFAHGTTAFLWVVQNAVGAASRKADLHIAAYRAQGGA